MNNPLFSIIISTKNEEKHIQACLASIKAQTYPAIEIIVVDNFSHDATVRCAQSFTSHVYCHGTERSAQRNFGVFEKATGTYVMYVDADMLLNKQLVAEAVAAFERDCDLVALYVPLRWRGNNWIIRTRGFERAFYDATVLDAVRIIKREVFIHVGGFDETLYAGEDWDLDKRVRQYGKTGMLSTVMYHDEDENITLKQFVKSMAYYSRNLSLYVKKWGKDDCDVKKQFGLLYRFCIVFLEKGKWRTCAAHPVRMTAVLYLKCVSAFIFFINTYKNRNA